MFSIKNDLLTGYFPVRFFFSESIQAGHIPWWNPYVNFGIPQHADLSGGFWNPITWLISITARYNIYTINLEALFYVLVGGIGMHRIGKIWNWQPEVKFIAAISYMCCGYFIGNMQHLNWISGAGYLPWCYYFYMQLLKGNSLKGLLQSIFAFSLLLTSSHPGILIGSIYFFALVTGNYIVQELKRKKNIRELISEQKSLLVLLAFLLLSNAALIISYIEILPYITRDSKPVIDSSGVGVTSFQSLISFLLPFATVKAGAFYMSDIALRNCYIGLIPFVFTVTGIYYNTRKRELNFFVITAVFFLFLSIGSLLQSKIYTWLPLISYVRLPAEFRIFSLFCLVVYGCSSLNNYSVTQKKDSVTQKISILFSVLIALLIVFSIIKISATRESVIYHTSELVNGRGVIVKLKMFIDYLSVYDTILVQGVINLTLLFFISKASRSKNVRLLLIIAIIDLFCATLLQLPFTGYGKLPQLKIQQIVNTSPKGIPIPHLHPISENDVGMPGIDSIVGNWSFYNKQPGSTQQALYPIIFKSEQYIFNRDSMFNIKQAPFLFFIPDAGKGTVADQKSDLRISYFSPNLIRFTLNTKKPGKVVVLYKYFPHWKASVNDKSSVVALYNNSFLAIPLTEPGAYNITLQYKPSFIRNIFLLQILLLLLEAGFLIALGVRKQQKNTVFS